MTVVTCLITLGCILLAIDVFVLIPKASDEKSILWYIVATICTLVGLSALLSGACMMDNINAETKQNTCEVMEKK